MQDPIVYRRARPEGFWHRPTGSTRDYRGGRELQAPAAERIAPYTGEPGCHPFHRND